LEESFNVFRFQELTSGVKGLAMDDDMEKSEGDRINILHDFIKAKLTDNAGNLAVADEKAIFGEAERLEIASKAPIVLCELLLDDKVIAQVQFQGPLSAAIYRFIFIIV
jgi:translation initiation factor 5